MMASSGIQVFSAARLFTGHTWIHNAEVQVINGRVVNISADKVTNPSLPLLVPAFIDLQLYGAAGRLFSVFPDVETLDAIRKSCEAGGATHFQPTVATNTPEVVSACIRAVRQYQQQGGVGCIGLHLEGPWIHPEKRGAHIASYIKRGTLEAAKSLLQEGGDVISMITLAPECCDKGVIEFLRAAGIVVSLGHSQATYQEAMEVFNKGVTAATHLYNAMSALQHRAPGVVGAIMDHSEVCASIIPDGHHVDAAAIRIAQKLMGERLFMITDAVTDTDTGPYQHQQAGDKYVSAGTLSGSMINMAEGVRYLVNQAGIAIEDALRMASLYPARIMNQKSITGTLNIGAPFHAALLDDQLAVKGIYRGS
ncbi:MAG: N-acetylglucosamine-6-phosphate deacetylase [Bacteroidota bacterium]